MTETTAIVPLTQSQAQAIEARQNSLLLAAQELVVDCPDGEKTAWEIVNAIGAFEKAIMADFKPSKTGAHGAWKAICAQEAGHLDRLKEPDKIVRGKLTDWETEKRRRQAEAERIAREAAEKVAAEAQRIAQKEAEERRLQEAMEAEAAGDAAKAEELLETPVEVAPVEVPIIAAPVAAVPKVEGAGAMVERWTFEIADPQAIPREYLTINEVAIGKVVQALKGQTNIAGVRAYTVLEPRRAVRR